MNTNQIPVLVVWLAVLASPALGQTSDDPTPRLAQALHHRRPEVRANAFQALLEQAQAGADLSEARTVLLGFANLQFQKQYDESTSLDYQVAALRVLVVIDEEIAQKVLSRTRPLVTEYERLTADGANPNELHQPLRNAFLVLQCVKTEDDVRESAALAARVLKLGDFGYEILLPVIYKAHPKASDRIQATRDAGIDLADAYECLFTGIYEAEIDDEAAAFLADLPEQGGQAQSQSYLLGLLAPRSDMAQSNALRIMQDSYEDRHVRHAAASGMLAAYPPEEPLYWRANAICDEIGWDQYRYLDVGPQFDKERHRQLEQERQNADAESQRPAEPREETAVAASGLEVTREDGEQYHKIFIPLVGQVRSVVVGGRIVPHVPQSVFNTLKSEAATARQAGKTGVAKLLEETVDSWEESVKQGTMVIVED